MRKEDARWQENIDIEIADILETTDAREAEELDYVIMLLGHRMDRRQFDPDLVQDMKRAIIERIEVARKLKTVEDWLDATFPPAGDKKQRPGLLARIRSIRRTIAR
jgi:hypothetical protein